MHTRELLEHSNHAPIILQRGQPRPRQDILPGGRVAILRLVHVPKQNQMDAIHPAATSPVPFRIMLECLSQAMRLIDRYICREVFSPALLGLGVFTFVFFVPQLVRLMELIVRHSADWGSIALLFMSAFPPVLTFTLPMAVLVGVLLGLARLSGDGAITHLATLGIRPRRLLIPVGDRKSTRLNS